MALADDAVVKAVEEVDSRREMRVIMKNVLFLSLAFFCMFTPYYGLIMLQSTLHRAEGLGVITSSVCYAGFVVSCLFMAKPSVDWLGHKRAVMFSFCGYMLWMAANGYATWITMVTSAIAIGLSAGPLWTAQGSYVTRSAARYATLSGEKREAVVTRFFGIFFFIFYMSSVVGAIVSSTVLRPAQTNLTSDEDIGLYCGINDCPSNNFTSTNLEISSNAVWTLVIIYLIVALMAVVITGLFVGQLPEDRRGIKNTTMSASSIATSFLAVISQMRTTNQLLLIPITTFYGFLMSLFAAEFMKSFVSCTVGIWMVGIMTIPYGIATGIFAFISGLLVKYVGRIPVFIAAFLVQVTIALILLLWIPSSDAVHVLYIVSFMYGLSDGVWQTQTSALYGAVFPADSASAYSNYRLWTSVGSIISYAYSPFLCTKVKVIIMVAVLVVGMLGYLAAEYNVTKTNKALKIENVVMQELDLTVADVKAELNSTAA